MGRGGGDCAGDELAGGAGRASGDDAESAGGILQVAERVASSAFAGPYGADSVRGGVLPDWFPG